MVLWGMLLQWAAANAETLGQRLRDAVDVLADSWIPHQASGQVARVAARFALVGIAGLWRLKQV